MISFGQSQVFSTSELTTAGLECDHTSCHLPNLQVRFHQRFPKPLELDFRITSKTPAGSVEHAIRLLEETE